MKVDRTSTSRPTSGAAKPSRKGAGGGGGDFAQALDSVKESGGTGGSVAPVSRLDSLLLVQEVPDATVGRRKATQRATTILDRLDDIRHALLTGRLPIERLERLRDMLKGERDRIDDPNLQAVIDEIELRAAVEIAKYESAGRDQP